MSLNEGRSSIEDLESPSKGRFKRTLNVERQRSAPDSFEEGFFEAYLQILNCGCRAVEETSASCSVLIGEETVLADFTEALTPTRASAARHARCAFSDFNPLK